MPRPRGHGPEYEVKREHVIDVGARLFARNGYEATSMVDLGEGTGLGKAGIYYYIGSKEDLLVEIQARVMDPLLDVASAIAKLDTAAVVRLRILSEALLSIMLRRLNHIWVYEHDYRSLPKVRRGKLLEQRHEFEQVVTGILQEAIDQGEFRQMDPSLAMLQFLNMHNRTYQWYNPRGPWDAEFLSREYCATLMRGMGSAGLDEDQVEKRFQDFCASDDTLRTFKKKFGLVRRGQRTKPA